MHGMSVAIVTSSKGGHNMVVRSRAHKRIAVRSPEYASPRRHHERGALPRYCILRIERELGEHEAWIVNIAPIASGNSSHITVHDHDVILEDQGTGHDGALAVWDAICSIEQRLREYRR